LAPRGAVAVAFCSQNPLSNRPRALIEWASSLFVPLDFVVARSGPAEGLFRGYGGLFFSPLFRGHFFPDRRNDPLLRLFALAQKVPPFS